MRSCGLVSLLPLQWLLFGQGIYCSPTAVVLLTCSAPHQLPGLTLPSFHPFLQMCPLSNHSSFPLLFCTASSLIPPPFHLLSCPDFILVCSCVFCTSGKSPLRFILLELIIPSPCRFGWRTERLLVVVITKSVFAPHSDLPCC